MTCIQESQKVLSVHTEYVLTNSQRKKYETVNFLKTLYNVWCEWMSDGWYVMCILTDMDIYGAWIYVIKLCLTSALLTNQ